MKRPQRNPRARARWTAILAIAVLSLAPAAWGHDDDDEYYYPDDDQGWYDDHYYPDGVYDDVYRVPAARNFPELRRHGYWRWVPAMGVHLWFPYVDVSWRPYYYGHWIHTPAGLTWVSYDPWGEIPHHYGQWVYVDHWGWGWVPGYEYAPAWVTWGVSDGYVGWAPCPPRWYRYPRYHRYRSGVHVSWYGYPGHYGYHSSGLSFSFWIFVSNDRFHGYPVHRHAVSHRHSLSFFKSKKVLPVGSRLEVDYVRRVSKEKIRTVDTVRKERRAGDRSIAVYEPRGQHEKVRAGREDAKRSYVKPKVDERSRRLAANDGPRSSGPRGKVDRPGKTRRVEPREAPRKVERKAERPVERKVERKTERPEKRPSVERPESRRKVESPKVESKNRAESRKAQDRPRVEPAPRSGAVKEKAKDRAGSKRSQERPATERSRRKA